MGDIVQTTMKHEVNWPALRAALDAGEDLSALRSPSVSVLDAAVTVLCDTEGETDYDEFVSGLRLLRPEEPLFEPSRQAESALLGRLYLGGVPLTKPPLWADLVDGPERGVADIGPDEEAASLVMGPRMKLRTRVFLAAVASGH